MNEEVKVAMSFGWATLHTRLVVMATAWAFALASACSQTDDLNPYHRVVDASDASGTEDVDTLIAAAIPLAIGIRTLGSVSRNERDVFLINPPVAEGALIHVAAYVLEGPSDIDVGLVSVKTGLALWADVREPSDSPQLVAVADAGAYLLLMTRPLGSPSQPLSQRDYAVTIGVETRSSHDCCSVGAGPGCEDVNTLACLCERDSTCCAAEYDALCVSEAISLCGLRCERDLPRGNCCAPTAATGCGGGEVERCVCGIDPYCCVGDFDENCVHLAKNQCGAPCVGDETSNR